VEVDQKTFDQLIEAGKIDGNDYRYVNNNFKDSARLFLQPGNMFQEFISALANNLM